MNIWANKIGNIIFVYNISLLLSIVIKFRKMIKNRFCTVSIKSNSLLSCLSVCTMCLLVFTSIIIITIISITPIIILGLGEINAGQRDVVLTPVNTVGYLNSTKISELSGQIAMPRLPTTVIIKGQSGVGWFMDLEL